MISYQFLHILALLASIVAICVIGGRATSGTEAIENRNLEVLVFGAIFAATVFGIIACAFAIYALII